MTDKSLIQSFNQAVALVSAQNRVDGYLEASRRLISNFKIGYEIALDTEDRAAKKALVAGLTDFAVEQANKTPQNVNHANAIATTIQLVCDTLNQSVNNKAIPLDFTAQLLTAAPHLASANGGTEYNVGAVKVAAKVAITSFDFEAATRKTPREEITAGLAAAAVELAGKQPKDVAHSNAIADAVQLLGDKLRDAGKSEIPQDFTAQLITAARGLITNNGGAQYNVALIKNAAKIAAVGYDVEQATQTMTRESIAAGLADFIVELANTSPKDISQSNAITGAVELLGNKIGSQAPHNLETRLLVAALKLSGKTGSLEYCDALIENTKKIAAIASQFHQAPEQGQGASSAAVSKFLTDSLQGVADLANGQRNLDGYSLALRMLNNNFVISYRLAAQDDQTKRELVKKVTDFIVQQAERTSASAAAAKVVGNGVQLLAGTLKTQATDRSLIPLDFTTRLLKAAKQAAAGGNEEHSAKIAATAREFISRPPATPYPNL